jgi:predicted nucleic acid-binding protein
VTDFVLDASALLELVTGLAPDPGLRRTSSTSNGAAPEVIDLEVVTTLRRFVRSGRLTADDARAIMVDIRETPISRTTHRPLLDRVWELRDSVAAYDAAYIALAERLRVPLLTCDARLGRAHGHRAEVVVYPTS